ncbi:hypothetical protein DUNSADRAFT_5378 [Dunaliella salina]|uniref:Uncharacterized protein n=1 Tax=Dunaliella salina TaxID=3046 RepID=A0ABQ7GQB8_DUNSA|nr:hypothetical protein DUNSADRAFT_5378 [Dunaliella salina]|eukprot:KAF5836799.1 hypothetical protein DUNSADRAFT_5378 [Dunaliella salina]
MAGAVQMPQPLTAMQESGEQDVADLAAQLFPRAHQAHQQRQQCSAPQSARTILQQLPCAPTPPWARTDAPAPMRSESGGLAPPWSQPSAPAPPWPQSNAPAPPWPQSNAPAPPWSQSNAPAPASSQFSGQVPLQPQSRATACVPTDGRPAHQQAREGQQQGCAVQQQEVGGGKQQSCPGQQHVWGGQQQGCAVQQQAGGGQQGMCRSERPEGMLPGLPQNHFMGGPQEVLRVACVQGQNYGQEENYDPLCSDEMGDYCGESCGRGEDSDPRCPASRLGQQQPGVGKKHMQACPPMQHQQQHQQEQRQKLQPASELQDCFPRMQPLREVRSSCLNRRPQRQLF